MRGLLTLAAAAVLLAALGVGARGFASDARLAFGSAPSHAIPPEIQSRAAALRARIPPRESVLYVGNANPPDAWFSRLWQRAFYPTRLVIFEREKSPVVLDLPADLPRPPKLEDLRKAYGIRYAISAGNPPLDPGFASREEIPPVPGYPYAIWFGELKP
ncbi:MAG TPA: hypothetical protein VKG01_19450 [Thermoanaerobaculia bacterium]|nr:hypothetical protein [Thermoanaerobaculia bacterium]